MALVHITVMPVGTVTTSIGDFVADAVRVLKKARVKYEVFPFGTGFEAEPGRAFALARRMHLAAFRRGAQRVLTTVQVDDRRDRKVSLREKVEAVERRIEGERKSRPRRRVKSRPQRAKSRPRRRAQGRPSRARPRASRSRSR